MRWPWSTALEAINTRLAKLEAPEGTECNICLTHYVPWKRVKLRWQYEIKGFLVNVEGAVDAASKVDVCPTCVTLAIRQSRERVTVEYGPNS